MFPVRVAVETVRAQHCLTCAHDGHVIIDTYAIVSGATVLGQLVDTVLSALGYPQLASTARGMVQVNNWKALPFEQITDNQEETVQNLFKDISNHITLRILTKPSPSDGISSQCIVDLKQRLLKTVVTKNPHILSTVDNQQIKDLITQVITSDDSLFLNQEQIGIISEWLETLDSSDERRSPIAQVQFNKLFEVPKLEKWFRSDPNPSRQKLLNYMNLLNQSPFRRSHQKISYQQICNWFNNQRAMARRPALAATPQIQTQIPTIPTMIGDFRPKFDFLLENYQKSSNGDDSRIDGGSDSPSPNDEELHSNSDGGPSDLFGKQNGEESTASSPDMSLSSHLQSLASSSPKPLLNNNNEGLGAGGLGGLNSASRSRLMFDPLTELPILEKWFEENPHPTWMQIDQYTQMLNSCPYRENYPHISQHNVKIWFKNRRAKCKRMQTGLVKMENLFA